MEHLNHQDLKYGIIYIYSDRRIMTMLHGALDFIRRIVNPMNVKCVDDPDREGALIVARRFNVGNIGQYATVTLHTSQYNRGGGQMEALHRFSDVLMDVSDPNSGDIVIDEADCNPITGGVHYGHVSHIEMPCAAPQDKTRVKKNARPSWRSLKDRLKDLMADEVVEDYMSSPDMQSSVYNEGHVPYTCEAASAGHHLQEEEEQELKDIEREREQALERIKQSIVQYIARYHDDPKNLMAELLRGKVIVGHPGRVLVNGDLRIVLPEYDEMEIKMPAMCRTLYILFMKQRKQCDGGIVLKNMGEYRQDLIDIYSIVKPGASDNRVRQTVDNLCDPYSESLNQMISRINRCIRNVITDKELCRQYSITGAKGEPYGIALSPDYLELPRAVLG